MRSRGIYVWRYRTEHSTCSEPLVIGDHVFFGGWDHYLYKFDKRSGELVWKYQLNGESDYGSPISAERMIFLPVGGSTFRYLNPESKEVIWTPGLESKIFNVTPVYNDGKVYISTLNSIGLGVYRSLLRCLPLIPAMGSCSGRLMEAED
ncbi:hypothetical protein CMK14_11620 [Candidatus Poribacteria bacterium]|nr:hypothetical protein [Candidatus Poribacteria bacterium]